MADILTKPLPFGTFSRLHDCLNVIGRDNAVYYAHGLFVDDFADEEEYDDAAEWSPDTQTYDYYCNIASYM